MLKQRLNPKSSRVYAYFALSLAIIFIIVSQITEHLGLKINVSASMPKGLWQLSHFNQQPQKNQIVVLCPPTCPAVALAVERGYFGIGSCPSGVVPLLKPIVAVAGDHVEVTIEGIKVNGHLLPNSTTRTIDGAGQFMPQFPLGHYWVKKGQVWLVSSFTSKSFDSRYFGPVTLDQISNYATPIWLKDS